MSASHIESTRSYNMSRIGFKNTKPEHVVRHYLFSKVLRYRKNDKRYPGKHDLFFPKYRIILFINCCFWQMNENCRYFVLPKSNQQFWYSNFLRKKQNDERNKQLLEQEGWQIITVWEYQLKKDRRQKALLTKTTKTLSLSSTLHKPAIFRPVTSPGSSPNRWTSAHASILHRKGFPSPR